MAGYQGQRGWNPVSLGAALAINGGVLAVLMLATGVTKGITDPFKRIEAVNIPIDPLPPPPPPKEEVKPVERSVTDPAPVPVPYIPPAPYPVPGPAIESTEVLPTQPPPTLPMTVPAGTGSGGTGAAAIPALPVLVSASVDPRYRDDFQPDYPPAERNEGRDGVVTVRVLVGRDGRVARIEPIQATSDAFFQATKRRALSKWRFRPATRDGVPTESWREMTVRFTMEDA